jgi:hypothetical protein
MDPSGQIFTFEAGAQKSHGGQGWADVWKKHFFAWEYKGKHANGVLHSKIHELWALRIGTQLREAESGFRYNPTSTFETYPFPWPPGQEPQDDPRVKTIAQAAYELVLHRDVWLNPPDAGEAELHKRTLTGLYNQRPTCLANCHRKLDEAVLAAYGWANDLKDEDILERLLDLNLERARKSEGSP